jgi:hypothetical protein
VWRELDGRLGREQLAEPVNTGISSLGWLTGSRGTRSLIPDSTQSPTYVCAMATTIYLSSTYEDLKDHRRVVFEAP